MDKLNKKEKRIVIGLIVFLLAVAIAFISIFGKKNDETPQVGNVPEVIEAYDADALPEDYDSAVMYLAKHLPTYSGEGHIELFNKKPFFTDEEKHNDEYFEIYSGLDDLGRCGVAFANICDESMPTGERSADISSIRPTGWQVSKYPNLIEDTFLYNRCHLIAFCLAAEEINEYNLITGTRAMNLEMVDVIEKNVAKYVEMTHNHVLYRVTPIFVDDELVARGLMIEVYSVEDRGVTFNNCYYFFNNQPGISIDYSTGDNKRG